MASLDALVVMALKDESQGLFEAAGIAPLYTGIGLVKATQKLTQKIMESRPKRVINLGTVGSRDLKQNQLVECTTFVQRIPHEFMKMSFPKISVEPCSTLQKVVCGSADFIEKAAPLTICDVYDMEAYALAYVCKQFNIPFNSIKFVTDRSNENLIHDWKKNLHLASESLFSYYREMGTKHSG